MHFNLLDKAGNMKTMDYIRACLLILAVSAACNAQAATIVTFDFDQADLTVSGRFLNDILIKKQFRIEYSLLVLLLSNRA